MTRSGESRRLLVGNAAQVAIGLAFVGVGTLASIALAARALVPAGFAAFITWWTVTNIFALAFSLTEAYLPRVLIGYSDPARERLVIARFARLEATMLLAMGLVGVVAFGWARERLFGGSSILVWVALVYTLIAAAQSLQRGVAIGRGRFSVISFQLAADGTTRVLLCAVVAIAGWASPEAFAVALCASALVGAIVAATRLRVWLAWSISASVVVPWVPLLWLSPAILVPLVVNNATVPWLSAGGSVSAHELGAFAGAVTLSRILTLLVGAAYGPVLNPLSNAVEAQEFGRFVRIHRGAVAVAGLAGGLYAAALWLLGPWLLQLYLGPTYVLERNVFAVLAIGSAFMFLSVVEQASLVALSAWRGVAAGWLLGFVAFAGLLWSSLEPVAAAAFAMTTAAAAAWAAMWVFRSRGLHQRREAAG